MRRFVSAEVEAWKEKQRDASWTRNQLPQLERGWAQMELPEHKARFYQVDVTRDGGVWVSLEEYSSETSRWLVFDAEGHRRGLVTLPGPFQIHDIGAEYVLGVYRDENDVEFVRMYALEEEGSG